MGKNSTLKKLSRTWLEKSSKYEYSYHFSWLGRPIIQFPQDIIAMQEIIWKIKPDLIIETGIARGGSLIFYASLLKLIGKGKVIGVDIDIRKHNKKAIKNHFLSNKITMIEGSSTDPKVVKQILKIAKNKKMILVVLDSDHTHQHVLDELNLYSPLISKDSYLVVFDTIVESMPKDFVKSRPWSKGNNPMTAVKVFLKSNSNFVVDEEIENKLLLTVGPSGYLKCIRKK